MNSLFWIIYIIVIIAVPVVFFILGYFLVKMAVKNGILEAYKAVSYTHLQPARRTRPEPE